MHLTTYTCEATQTINGITINLMRNTRFPELHAIEIIGDNGWITDVETNMSAEYAANVFAAFPIYMELFNQLPDLLTVTADLHHFDNSSTDLKSHIDSLYYYEVMDISEN